MRAYWRVVAAVAVLAMFVSHPTVLDGCGPFFPSAVFVRTARPDGPMKDFARGQLGVVLPTWWRAYLTVAYLNLSGRPMSEAEQASFVREYGGVAEGSRGANAMQEWLDARAKFTKDPSFLVKERRTSEGYFEQVNENCLDPAFRNATATLNDRAKVFGAKSTELQEWIAGQDSVFKNCMTGKDALDVIPRELPQSANRLLRADRAYQIAAAHFYASDFDQAEREFDAIAKNADSPWKTIAPYLAARAVIRRGTTVTKPDESFDAATLKRAQARLQAMLADPKAKSLHRDAFRLLSFVNVKLEPQRWQHELAKRLVSGQSGANFGQELVDYTWLLDRYLEKEPDFPGIEPWTDEYRAKEKEWRLQRYKELRSERADDLSDWLMTVQSTGPDAARHAFARWTETKSQAWLVAALMKSAGGDKVAAELLGGAEKLPAESPAFATVAYHRSRLYIERREVEEARRVLETVQARALPASAKNLFLDQQLLVAPTQEEFVRALARVPSGVNEGYGTDDATESTLCSGSHCDDSYYAKAEKGKARQLLPLFDPVGARLLNTKVPTTVLVKIAVAQDLPENLRRRMAPAMWARAALLDDVESAKVIGVAAVASEPAMAPYVKGFEEAKNADARRFAAVFAIAHFPGLRPFVDDGSPRITAFAKIDNYRDNWWCGDVGSDPEQANFSKEYNYKSPEEIAVSPAFLSAELRTLAAQQWKQLHATGYSDEYLPKMIIAFAKAHPEDSRVPEALHYAVRVTRFGCGAYVTDGQARGPNYSREAFTILHKQYPKSEWAKKTPNWY